MSEACLCGARWWVGPPRQPGAVGLLVPRGGDPPPAELLAPGGTALRVRVGADRAACGDRSWCHATRQPVEILVCSTIVNSFRLRLHLLSLLISVAIQEFTSQDGSPGAQRRGRLAAGESTSLQNCREFHGSSSQPAHLPSAALANSKER